MNSNCEKANRREMGSILTRSTTTEERKKSTKMGEPDAWGLWKARRREEVEAEEK